MGRFLRPRGRRREQRQEARGGNPPGRRNFPMDSHANPLLVFDFADRRGRPRRLCFTRPERIVAARTPAEVRPALREVEAGVASGLYAGGYVGYEAAPAFDTALAVRGGSPLPLLWFGLFRQPAHEAPAARGGFRFSDWTPSVGRAAYEQNFAAARAAIARGDTYQINYSFRLRARFEGDALACYEQLASNQRAAYCAHLDTGRFKILSASPELFFRWDGRGIVAKPMKGTARRGLWPEEDEEIGARLAASEKNRAENVMIVDLMRSDLGRVARVGSVRVRELCRVERYPTVFQLTSTVEARTRPGVTLEEIFAAAFPSGSVTGAPKVSTMRLVAALEDSPRGVYCGGVGLLTPGGESVFNVAIRTVVIDAETGAAEYGVGGGLTWDSACGDEYEEALAKAAVLAGRREPFRLLETMRLEGGRYSLLDRHLAR
ncbi:MAG: aminodeoxychorismate synthase component I, partial [Acidobacteria bacterium]|nr:aminodeoxychorismate synthase component I [Acidobacteriota bacterium]